MALTAQRKRLIEEYLVDCNAVQAALRAGYSKSFARTQTHLVLKEPEVAAALKEALDARAARTEISADWVLKNLKEVAERCMDAVPVLDREGKETGEWKFEPSGANRSLELIGKHLGMFTDKLDVSGSLRLTHEQALAELE